MEQKTRNDKIDIIRGLAILMVVLVHTVSYFIGGQDSIIHNIIFSIQIPLFMLVSGFINLYSKPIQCVRDFFKRLLRRSCALLLPWLVWTVLKFIIFNCSFGEDVNLFQHLEYVFFNTNSGYWFLPALWTVDLIVSLSALLAYLIRFTSKSKLLRILIQFVFVGVLWVGLAVIGKAVGMYCFSIKYSLYYLPFYCLGYLFGQFNDEINKINNYKTVQAVVVAILTVIYFILITKINIQAMEYTPVIILVRIFISLSGCAIVFYLVNSVKCQGRVWRVIEYFGIHSIELYAIHCFFLKIMPCSDIALTSLQGIIACTISYGMCIMFSAGVMRLIGVNGFLYAALFGRKKN